MLCPTRGFITVGCTRRCCRLGLRLGPPATHLLFFPRRTGLSVSVSLPVPVPHAALSPKLASICCLRRAPRGVYHFIVFLSCLRLVWALCADSPPVHMLTFPARRPLPALDTLPHTGTRTPHTATAVPGAKWSTCASRATGTTSSHAGCSTSSSRWTGAGRGSRVVS